MTEVAERCPFHLGPAARNLNTEIQAGNFKRSDVVAAQATTDPEKIAAVEALRPELYKKGAVIAPFAVNKVISLTTPDAEWQPKDITDVSYTLLEAAHVATSPFKVPRAYQEPLAELRNTVAEVHRLTGFSSYDSVESFMYAGLLSGVRTSVGLHHRIREFVDFNIDDAVSRDFKEVSRRSYKHLVPPLADSTIDHFWAKWARLVTESEDGKFDTFRRNKLKFYPTDDELGYVGYRTPIGELENEEGTPIMDIPSTYAKIGCLGLVALGKDGAAVKRLWTHTSNLVAKAHYPY